MMSSQNLFAPQQAQLWSRFRFAASSIRRDLWMEDLEPSPAFAPAHPTLQFFNQTSPNIFLPSSPPQLVPEKSSQSPFLRQRLPVEPSTPVVPPKTADPPGKKESSSKLAFTLTIFAVGLVLGYLLTTTCPPGLVLRWLVLICDRCTQLFLLFFHTVHRCISSFLFNVIAVQ